MSFIMSTRLAAELDHAFERNGWSAEDVKKLSSGNVLTDVLATVRGKPIASVGNMPAGTVTRRVRVDRTRTPQQVIDATGRVSYVDKKVLATIPRGEGEEVEIEFFKLDRYVSDVELEREYELRGRKPADPCSLAAVNEADPAFADDHPNGTHWKDANGSWCFATFFRWGGGRGVRVDRDDDAWDGRWWFAGVRK